MDDTEEQYQYEYEIKQIEEMFPNAKFSIAINIEDMDNIITEQTNIVVKHTYACYCYDNCNKNTDFFYITNRQDDKMKMTNKFIITELIKQGLKLECNHVFLEGFIQSKDSVCQFELLVGS